MPRWFIVSPLTMKKLAIITVFFSVLFLPARGQGEIDEQQKLFFRNESSWGLTLTTAGYGAGYRYGKRMNFFNSRLYELSVNIIKHPKEIKGSNPNFPNAKRYVFGKENFFFNIQASYGFQRIKFKKKDKGGIEVRFLYTAGISLGFSKPVYYEITYPSPTPGYYYTQPEKFNPNIHSPLDIYSRSSFFKGFSEIGIVPGLTGKLGINFEFSSQDATISSVEIGTTADVYTKKIPIMASNDNRFFFPTLYVSVRFGKVVDKRSQVKIDYLEGIQ